MVHNDLQTASNLNPFQRTLTRLASMFSLAVVVVGFLVLLGWQFDIELFKRVVPTLVAMNPTTTTTFVYAGVSLMLLQTSHPHVAMCMGKNPRLAGDGNWPPTA